jgi:calcineurin-like phosphoesterase family protein/purple acid phosphatase-like protein
MRTHVVATAMLTFAAAGVAVAASVVRGPYLQTPTSHSMILRWRTDVATTGRVAYGAAPGSLGQHVDDATPRTEHEMTVAGLAPDTQYYYAVGSVAGAFVGDDADHYFRTAPPTGSTRALRFWAIGDAGFVDAAHVGNVAAVRDAFASLNGSSHTDLFLLLGDNAYLTGTDAQYQDAVFDPHHDMLLTTPVWSVVGNHERFTSFPLTQTGPYFDMFTFPKSAQAGGVASGTEAYYSFDYGNVHFVVLDSEDHTASPYLATMTNWLLADLQATTADWIIAMWHRPPYTKGLLHDSDVETNEVTMRTSVVPILEQYGVDLVLSGHSHSYERSAFIDGHYGLSTTFTSANLKDPGDGDPSGDGPYHKPTAGRAANEGAVYVVDGSGSEVRPVGNHPAMLVKLAELGSLVVDVDRDVLTARFLSSTGSVDDEVRIVKGTACPKTPATGCFPAARGRLNVRNTPSPSRDRWSWRWKGGTVDPAVFGSPTGETDLAACVYDATGALLGGQILHGAAEWHPIKSGLLYNDPTLARHGLKKIRVRFGTGFAPSIDVKTKGANVGSPTLPATLPLIAQLVNTDTGACWQSTFTTTRQNKPDQVVAAIP